MSSPPLTHTTNITFNNSLAILDTNQSFSNNLPIHNLNLRLSMDHHPWGHLRSNSQGTTDLIHSSSREDHHRFDFRPRTSFPSGPRLLRCWRRGCLGHVTLGCLERDPTQITTPRSPYHYCDGPRWNADCPGWLSWLGTFCFRCGEGHPTSDCPVPRTLYCGRCGDEHPTEICRAAADEQRRVNGGLEEGKLHEEGEEEGEEGRTPRGSSRKRKLPSYFHNHWDLTPPAAKTAKSDTNGSSHSDDPESEVLFPHQAPTSWCREETALEMVLRQTEELLDDLEKRFKAEQAAREGAEEGEVLEVEVERPDGTTERFEVVTDE